MIPQLLEIEPCKDYTETPLQTLDRLYVIQLKKIFAPCTRSKEISRGVVQRRNSISMGGAPT